MFQHVAVGLDIYETGQIRTKEEEANRALCGRIYIYICKAAHFPVWLHINEYFHMGIETTVLISISVLTTGPYAALSKNAAVAQIVFMVSF